MGKKILMPPNWQLADAHSKSVTLGKPRQIDQEIQYTRCECCRNIIQKQPLPLCENSKQMNFLGPSLPLYFSFVKYCIFNLMVLSVSGCFLTLSWAVNENQTFCVDNIPRNLANTNNTVAYCSSNLVYISRISTQVTNNESMLRISLFFIYLILLIHTRDALNKIQANYSSITPSYGKFSVLFQHLPQRMHIKQQLKEWLGNYQVTQIATMRKFDIISSLQKLLEAEYIKRMQLAKKTVNVSRNSKVYDKLVKQIQQTENKIQILSQNLLQSLQKQINFDQKDQILVSKALVTLDTTKEAENIVKLLSSNKNIQMFPENWNIDEAFQMTIIAAPEPHQIIWKNANSSTITKLIYEILSCLVLIVLLGILAFGYLLLRSLIKQWEKTSGTDQQNLISLVNGITILSVICINTFFLFFLCYKISSVHRYMTKTSQQLSLLVKYLLSSFFVTGFMTLVAEAFSRNNVYSSKFGIIETQSIIIILCSLLTPFIWMINPWAIVNRLKQTCYRNDHFLSQQQANTLMQKVEFNITRHYSDALTMIWLISFYSSLIPISVIMGVVGLSYYYWVNKGNLLWRSSINNHIPTFSNLKIMSFLQFSLVLRPIGQITFDLWIRNGPTIGSYFCLGISFFYFCLPKQRIFSFFHQQDFLKNFWSLKDLELGDSYLDLHPILGKKMKRQMIGITKLLYENQLQKQFEQYVSIHENPSILDQSYRAQVQSIKGKLKDWKHQLLNKNHKNFNVQPIEQPHNSIYQL